MIKLSSALLNIPIISLQTGAQVGVALRPLINPNNLKIEGWFSVSKFTAGTHFLPAGELRDIARQGIAVDEYTSITEFEELPRLEPVLRIDYQVIGKTVVTKSKKKLGKVDDYAADLDSMFIQKFYVSPGALKMFTKDQLTISRSQIIEITDKKIIVRELEATVTSYFKVPAPVFEG